MLPSKWTSSGSARPSPWAERIGRRQAVSPISRGALFAEHGQSFIVLHATRETGYLLGYIPAAVSYKEIGEERAGRRGSIALVYLRVSEEPERNIYPPTQYRDVISRLVEYNG